jgi:hypothetical protein
MIAKRIFAFPLVIWLLAVWAPGCLEHQVKTTVYADGSCERTITLNPEAKRIPRSSFPLPIDGSWDTSWTKSGDAKYIVTFTKRFKDYEELSGEYVHPADSMKIRLDLRVTKIFRWFYTYYDYAETYGRFTDYTLIDPQTVLTDEEIHRLTYGDTSQTLKNKKDEWVARNLFEAIYRRFASGAEGLQDTLLTPAKMAAHKEELFRLLFGFSGSGNKLQDPESTLKQQSSYRGTEAKVLSDSGVTDEGLNAFAQITARTLKSDAVWKIKDSIRAGWQDLLKMLEGKGTAGESFTNAVVLPGILLETTAPDVKGSSASWKFNVDQLELRDFEMRARSRVVNEWAIAVTGLIVLALLGFLFLALIRNAHTPFLLFHGTDGRFIDIIKKGQVVFDSGNEPKKFIHVSGAGPTTVPRAVGVDRYLKAIEDFIGVHNPLR